MGWFFDNVNLLELPQFGWNTKLEPNYASDTLVINRKARKRIPDLVLSYEDNRDGYAELSRIPYQWGYEVSMFLPETKRITISALTPEQEAIIAEQRQEINFQIAELKNTNLNVLGSQLNDALENALEVLRDYEARLRSQSETVIAYRNGDNVRILIEEKTLLGGSRCRQT